MEQIIDLRVSEVEEQLDNSVLFDGQIGFVYGREISRPSSVDVEMWLGSRISDMSWGEAEEHLYKAELKRQKQEMKRLANALEDWVAYYQREHEFDVLAVKAVFDDDPEDGQWFVGLEDTTPSNDWDPTSSEEIWALGNLGDIQHVLAKKFDVAQYRNGEYLYNPEDWWSPTMVAMKMVEK